MIMVSHNSGSYSRLKDPYDTLQESWMGSKAIHHSLTHTLLVFSCLAHLFFNKKMQLKHVKI